MSDTQIFAAIRAHGGEAGASIAAACQKAIDLADAFQVQPALESALDELTADQVDAIGARNLACFVGRHAMWTAE